jgi:hypothetical protein
MEAFGVLGRHANMGVFIDWNRAALGVGFGELDTKAEMESEIS